MIALISLAFNILVAAVGLTWGIGKIRDAVRDEIEDHKEKFDAEVDSLRQNTGEGLSAIRQKINDVELFVRDTFVRRDTFARFVDTIQTSLNAQFDKFSTRMDRMENKIDKLAERSVPQG